MLRAATTRISRCAGLSQSRKCLEDGATLWLPTIDSAGFHAHSHGNLHANQGTESVASPTGPSPLSSGGPYACRLTSRSVVSFDGVDTINFLQGLVTNDLARFAEQPPPPSGAPVPTVNEPASAHAPLYAAILSPQGRVLFDLFFYRPSQPAERLDWSGSGPASGGQGAPVLVADVDASAVDELLSTLKKHRLRANVHFEPVADLAAWARFGGILAQEPGAAQEAEAGAMGYGGTDDQVGRSAAEASPSGWLWHKDPRLAALGQRGVFPTQATPPLVEAQEEVGEDHFRLWRYEHGVAEGAAEIPPGEALPLEYNLEGLHALSFEKGCYVGQELTARTHHRGVVRKRILPVHFLAPGHNHELQKAAVPGVDVVESGSGKKAGRVAAALGPRGLAHLRLASALGASPSLKLAEPDGATVEPQRPKWWPSQWGAEEHGDATA